MRKYCKTEAEILLLCNKKGNEKYSLHDICGVFLCQGSQAQF